MKKENIIISGIVVLLIATVFTLFKVVNPPQQQAPEPSVGGIRSNFTAKYTGSGTSTPIFMTPGTATTSVMFSNDSANLSSIFIRATASTSATVLRWNYQWSNGDNCDIGVTPENCQWYEEDGVVLPTSGFVGTLLHSSTTAVVHQWGLNSTTASTSVKMIQVPILAAKYVRAVFSLPIGVTNAAITVVGNTISEGQ